MKLGLENIRCLLDALGDPHRKYKKVQVAGTNGKGSVCAFLDAICLNAGISTGLYTSPHLVSITERVKIGGFEIAEDEFARLASRVRGLSETLLARGELEYLPTFFEQMTAIALTAFADAEVELAILETGLGGRLDATTAADAEIAAITRIDLDHQEYLGETLAEIAAEKAAIIHKDSIVVVAPQDPVANRVISGHCRAVGVDPCWVLTSVELTPREHDFSEGAVFNTGEITIYSSREAYRNISLGLWGKHQWINAGLAVATAEVLQELDFDIRKEHIRDGLIGTRHPGRLQFEGRYLLDGAHNTGGAHALAEYIDEFIKQPITLIFGAMRGKAVEEMARELFPKVETLILTRAENSRSVEVEEIERLVPPDFDKSNIIRTDTVAEALAIAPNHSYHGLILITGSLYLVGEAKRILNSQI
jgi:dihydrofolate synthase/folylpolyglutamate synthase